MTKQINLQQFTQPYKDKYIGLGSEEGMNNFLNPTATTAELADVTSDINTRDKFTGKPAYDSTLGSPVWASGASPSDSWDPVASGSGIVVQEVNVQDGEVATSSSPNMPDNDTIPQITEGTEYMTLAITPDDAANILKIASWNSAATTLLIALLA